MAEIDASTINNHSSKHDRSTADSTEKKKKIIIKQINDLRNLILQIEQGLHVVKFGAVAKTQEYEQCFAERCTVNGQVPDIFTIIRKDLFKYAGFYCVKLNRDQHVFNFTSSVEDESIETFSVQICNKDEEATIGKWIMPMSSDIRKILQETPITNLGSVIPFLRNCKHHVFCYTKRKSEFYELKKYVSEMSNIEISSNLGYTIITLNLLRVYNKSKELYVNLIIHMPYKPEETRPSTINVGRDFNKSLSTSEESEIKSFAKHLKNHSLKEGLKLIMETEHPIFTWTSEELDDDEVENDSASASPEESIQYKRKGKRKKGSTNSQSNDDVEKRNGKRKKRTIVASREKKKRINFSESNENSEKSHEASLARENTMENSRIPSSENISSKPIPKVDKKQPNKKTKHVLRQTTLSFRKNESKESSEDEAERNSGVRKKKRTGPQKTSRKDVEKDKLVNDEVNATEENAKRKSPEKPAHPVGILSTKKMHTNRVNFAPTSTPLHRTTKNRVKFLPVNETELSPITPIGSNDNS